MSNEEKIDAYIFRIYDNQKDVFEEQVLIIEDVLIAHGTWATGADARIEGILQGLELANFPANKIETAIIDPVLKRSLNINKLMEYAKS